MRLWCQCFPKRISNFQLIWSQNSFSLCLTLSILNVFWPREDCSVSSLHDWALTCVSGWFGELCSQEWFVEVFLTSCSDFHDRIMSVFNAVPPEAWRSEASSIDSGPCSLLDFSTFTKSFHGFMYYWQTFWNWFKMCKFAIFKRLVNLCLSLLQRNSFFFLSDLLPLYLISCKIFLHQNVPFYTSGLLFPLFWLFAAVNSKWANTFHEIIKMYRFKHLMFSNVLLWIKHVFMRFAARCIIFYLHFKQHLSIIGNGFVVV